MPQNNYNNATLIGATGLIGGHHLRILINDSSFTNIKILVRRPIDFQHPKLQTTVIDFNDEDVFKQAIAYSDIVFCAIGTTNYKVKGDKNAYRMVDYHIPVSAAKFAAQTGCNRFSLVSSVGANSHSRNFYLKLKGDVEEAVTNHIPATDIFRPSLLIGQRNEIRQGERAAQAILPKINFLLPSKYKAILAADVAKAMVAASKAGTALQQIFHYKEMMLLAHS